MGRHRSHRETIDERFLSPSLQPFFAQAVELAYPDALRIATLETGLQAVIFPATCPFHERDLLDEGYWPDASSA
nr:DUF29 family protein [Thiorhodococcus mannitoliphagus]